PESLKCHSFADRISRTRVGIRYPFQRALRRCEYGFPLCEHCLRESWLLSAGLERLSSRHLFHENEMMRSARPLEGFSTCSAPRSILRPNRRRSILDLDPD